MFAFFLPRFFIIFWKTKFSLCILCVCNIWDREPNQMKIDWDVKCYCTFKQQIYTCYTQRVENVPHRKFHFFFSFYFSLTPTDSWHFIEWLDDKEANFLFKIQNCNWNEMLLVERRGTINSIRNGVRCFFINPKKEATCAVVLHTYVSHL